MFKSVSTLKCLMLTWAVFLMMQRSTGIWCSRKVGLRNMQLIIERQVGKWNEVYIILILSSDVITFVTVNKYGKCGRPVMPPLSLYQSLKCLNDKINVCRFRFQKDGSLPGRGNTFGYQLNGHVDNGLKDIFLFFKSGIVSSPVQYGGLLLQW